MVFRRGMPADAVIGYWDAAWNHDMNSPVGFTRNRTFIDLLQRVMCAELLASEGIHEAAAERGSGGISIIDLRNPYDTEEMVLPEDFLGAFEIVDGTISAETPDTA
jgi:hypothetical protein